MIVLSPISASVLTTLPANNCVPSPIFALLEIITEGSITDLKTYPFSLKDTNTFLLNVVLPTEPMPLISSISSVLYFNISESSPITGTP